MLLTVMDGKCERKVRWCCVLCFLMYVGSLVGRPKTEELLRYFVVDVCVFIHSFLKFSPPCSCRAYTIAPIHLWSRENQEQISMQQKNQDVLKQHKTITSAMLNCYNEGIIPTEKDVLFGKGKGVHNHPGNRHFRNLILGLIDEYQALKSLNKHQCAVKVRNEIHNRNGRFLSLQGKHYCIETESKIMTKIKQAFRDRLKSRHVSSHRDHFKFSGQFKV